jgi:hypothetical protein
MGKSDLQSTRDQLRPQMISEQPAGHAAAIQVDDRRQVGPALPSGHVRTVAAGASALILAGLECALDEVELRPVTFFLVIELGRLGHRADALGMANCPLSLMIWGVLPPSAPGAPRSRDRSLSAVRE